MVFTDFSFLRERDDATFMPVIKKQPPSPVVCLTLNPADDYGWEMLHPMESPVKASLVTTAVAVAPEAVPFAQPRPTRLRQGARLKSYSECGPVLERMVPTNTKKARPYSTGDVEDLRRVSISSFSKSKSGTWMFKVDISTDEFSSYAIRRRFSDFKKLHENLQELVFPERLPDLPTHGIMSVMQMFFSPEPTLRERAKKLEDLLKYVNKHSLLSTSKTFTKFLGKNPSSLEVGYVSLSCYEAPTSDGHFGSSRGRTRSRRQSS